MYNQVKRLYLANKIDEKTGLKNAVRLKWITEEEKQELIELKKAMQQQEQQKNEEEHKEGQEETL